MNNVNDFIVFRNSINNCLSQDKYISKSEYLNIVDSYRPLINNLLFLRDHNIIDDYCKNNNLSHFFVNNTIDMYLNIDTLVEQHNDIFLNKMLVQEKNYLDNILKQIDDNIILDDDQRKVVLCDEDYTLVVAGAGAGKTTTIAAKVKYLVERKNINPEDILIISFTNKAVNELKDRINKQLNIPSPITTFHSTGNAILRKKNNQPLNIADPSKIYFVVSNYFKTSIFKDEEQLNNLILFFASYFNIPNNISIKEFFNTITSNDFSTIKGEVDKYVNSIVDARSKKLITITNEVVRSREEVIIANFLYLNGIDYEYEPIYPYNISFSKKPYTPDFLIKQGDKECYIEHFGISQDGKNSRYSSDELEKYKNVIRNKIKIHKYHGTNLLYTFSRYNDKKSLLYHLSNELKKRGFVLNARSKEDIVREINSNQDNSYIKGLIMLICRFINNFKTNDYNVGDFDKMINSTRNERAKVFLKICRECYLNYQSYLFENNLIDFEDMINNSSKMLRDIKEMKELINFKYIFVDEYQDISRQRFNLTKALSDVTNAKIVAVGDDWQSIYAFSGSDISLFTKFSDIMGYAKVLKIVKTYRNSQEVIDIAGNFIQKNSSQIKKNLISPKRIKDPIIVYSYENFGVKTGDEYSNGFVEMGHAIENILENIMKSNVENGKDPFDGKILILGRYNFDGYNLEKTKAFSFKKTRNRVISIKYPKFNMTFMTAHSSKGLGYDNVIIINAKNDTFGFPSKIEDDPVLKFVIKDDTSYNFAEERRLFYVALTRTKNRVYLVAPKYKPSIFLIELIKDYKNIVVKGEFDLSIIDEKKMFCPICGYPLKYRYKSSYGLKLYICSNEPEICGFMTNNLNGEKMFVVKCGKCRDGYLVVKRSDNHYFLGCTNYKHNGLGCNNSMSKNEFYYNYLGISENNN